MGAAGHYLLGKISRLKNNFNYAVGHYQLALQMDPLLWCAYEELCLIGARGHVPFLFSDWLVACVVLSITLGAARALTALLREQAMKRLVSAYLTRHPPCCRTSTPSSWGRALSRPTPSRRGQSSSRPRRPTCTCAAACLAMGRPW